VHVDVDVRDSHAVDQERAFAANELDGVARECLGLRKRLTIGADPVKDLSKFGDALPEVRAVYEANGKLTDEEFGRQVFGDALFTAAAQTLAGYVDKTGSPARVYHFAYVADHFRGKTLKILECLCSIGISVKGRPNLVSDCRLDRFQFSADTSSTSASTAAMMM